MKISYILLTMTLFWGCGLLAQSFVKPPYFEGFGGAEVLASSRQWIIINEGTNVPTATFIGSEGSDRHLQLAGGGEQSSSDFRTCVNGAVLNVDLSTEQEYGLVFRWKTVATDASNYNYLTSLSDGVYFSDNNGLSYVKVFSFGRNDSWQTTSINIKKKCVEYQLNPTSVFKILFQYETRVGSVYMGAKFNQYLCIDDVFIANQMSQQLRYTYDNTGNRIRREYIPLVLKRARLDQLGQVDDAEQELPSINDWGQREVSVFPNPTKSNLRVTIKGGDQDAKYNYTLYSSAGVMLSKGDVLNKEGYVLEMERYHSGIYILTLQSGNENLTYKIIKE